MEEHQETPFPEKLDWCFSYESWTSYPNTISSCLVEPISDQTPCLIQVGTKIPKARIFIFENFWIRIEGLKYTIKNIWYQPVVGKNTAKNITAKFKRFRKGLKLWAKNISNVVMGIMNTNALTLFF